MFEDADSNRKSRSRAIKVNYVLSANWNAEFSFFVSKLVKILKSDLLIRFKFSSSFEKRQSGRQSTDSLRTLRTFVEYARILRTFDFRFSKSANFVNCLDDFLIVFLIVI